MIRNITKTLLLLLIALICTEFGLKAQIMSKAWRAGGNQTNDQAECVATDPWGNIAIGGSFILSIGIPTSSGTGTTTLTSKPTATLKSDPYLVKYDINGVTQWVFRGYGLNNDGINGVAFDDTGNVYISGYFNSGGAAGDTFTLGNLSGKNVTFYANGGADFFAAKLDPNGKLIWAKQYGGDQDDIFYKLHLDKKGNIYCTGFFLDTTVIGTKSLKGNGGTEGLLLKLDNAGNPLWANIVSSRGNDFMNDVAIGTSGDVYACGRFVDTGFAGAVKIISKGGFDAFVTKYDGATGRQKSVYTYGGRSNDYLFGINIDSAESVYIAGAGLDSVTYGGTLYRSKGFFDGFVAKLDSGLAPKWGKTLGGANTTYADIAYSVATTNNNIINIGGTFASTVNFLGSTQTSKGQQDAYLLGMDSSGTKSYLNIGSSSTNDLYASIASYKNAVVVAGEFNGDVVTSTNTIKFSSGTANATSIGAGDILVGYFTNCSNKLPSTTITNSGKLSFCPGDSVNLIGSPATGSGIANSYFLKGYNQANYNNDTLYSAKVSGTFAYRIISDEGCFATSTTLTTTKNIGATVSLSSSSLKGCIGDSIKLSAVGSGLTSYSWYKNGFKIIGANTVNFFAKFTGNYSVKVSTGAGCPGLTPEDTLVFFNKPAKPIITSPSTTLGFCTGDSVEVDASKSFSKLTYQWKNNSALISGATSKKYYINATGKYALMVTDSNGCSNQSIDTFAQASSKPTFSLFLSGKSKICDGDSSRFDAGTSTSYKYQWYKDGVAVSGATNSQFYVKKSGVYAVVVDNGLGCTKKSSDNLISTVAIPNKPKINLSGNTMTSSLSANDYAWYQDGNLISGANTQSYNGTKDGKYFVTIYDANNCHNSSDTLNFKFTGIEEQIHAGISLINIYPNPVIKSAILNVSVDMAQSSALTITSLSGQIVYSSTLKLAEGLNQLILNTESMSLSSGQYFLTIQGNKGLLKVKFIVTRD